MNKIESKCMYCGSTSYGSGCIFSAKRIHIHIDDPTRCVYCGTMSYGSGCIFNPFSGMHVHGLDVGQTVKEATQKTVELVYITDRLFEKITDSRAYKIKLIDESGKLVRTPDTVVEQCLVSPLSLFFNNIKKYIFSPYNSLIESFKLIAATRQHNESVEEFKTKTEFKSDITHHILALKSSINNYATKMSLESLESAIEEAILESSSE